VCDEAGSDEVLETKIQNLRGRIAELASIIHRLDQSGRDNATAQLLLSRKRAELDDVIKRGRSDAARSAPMVRPQRG